MNRATNVARSQWSRRLGQVLLTSGQLTDESVAYWLAEAESSNKSLATVLLENKAADSRVVLEMMGQVSSLPVVDPFNDPPNPDAMGLVTGELARDLRAIGYRLDGNKLVLAFSDPPGAEDLRALAIVFERQVLAVLADPVTVDRIIEVAYPVTENGAEGPDLSNPAVVARVIQAAYPSAFPPAQPPVSDLAPEVATEPTGTDEWGADVMNGQSNEAMNEPFDQLVQEAEKAVQQARLDGEDAGGIDLLDSGESRDLLAALEAEADRLAQSGEAGGAGDASPAPGGGAGAGVTDLLNAPGGQPVDDGVPEHIDDLLHIVAEAGASDLHLSAGMPPSMRINGSIRPIEGYEPLGSQTIREMIFGILTQVLRERFEADHELDTSHALPGVGRFRVNVMMQRSSVGAVLRAIPHTIPPFDALGLPDVVKSFTELQRGLVLVTGPTGSGKSTTLASLLDIINRSKPLHIVTVEDPIEFLHRHQRAIINQREVGQDTMSFSQALRHVLRQDPDVILVGEMRDLETISTALTAAETGHLVFATLHTQDAPQTIDRIIDVFPTGQQSQIRVQLSTTLEAVVTQQLILSADGAGRVAAAEVMVATPAVRNLIREAKTHQIPSLMQSGGKFGMQTMDQALADMVKTGRITQATAFARCHSEEELGRYLHT